jgi:NAD(P)-dependent dehydrogenase (short-subunit alcohol dehydrogenase family)
MLDKLSLDGKVIIVTGGGTGLGRAMVGALARAGANIALSARRVGPIEEAAAEVKSLGRDAMAVTADLTKSDQANDMVKKVLSRFGKVDVLINNAAQLGAPRTPIWDMSDEEWRTGIDTTLTSAFYCSRAIAKHMADRKKGKIINVASGYGMRGGKDMYTYTCAKGGVIQLTRTLALSLAPYGVTANTIVPGFIPTREGQGTNPEFMPMGKFPKPEDLGPVAVFLASDASDYMTGEMISVDGAAIAAGFSPTGYAPIVALR